MWLKMWSFGPPWATLLIYVNDRNRVAKCGSITQKYVIDENLRQTEFK